MNSNERYTNILRVAVANNFNFTQRELEALDDISWDKSKVFVNSNSFVTVKSDYPSFLTVNPYLDTFVEPVGDLSKVRACRVKVVYKENGLSKDVCDAITWCAANDIPVLITFMRFSSSAMLNKYSPGSKRGYEHERGWWRLTSDAKRILVQRLEEYFKSKSIDLKLLHYCDLKEEGCPYCGNCHKLAFPEIKTPCVMHGVNLSASGDNGRCSFHCPDCWAKRLQKSGRCVVMNKITQNSKQKGHK